MQFNIVDVSVETIARGKAKYSIATVAYTHNGEQRSKKIMSFANPSVFKAVQELVGNTVEVQIGKNEQGYDEWKSISLVGNTASQSAAAPASAPTTRVTGSNYETKEERAARQVLIVKQSSVSSAIALLKTEKNVPTVEDVLNTAQTITDWVFSKEAPSGDFSDMKDDIPF